MSTNEQYPTGQGESSTQEQIPHSGVHHGEAPHREFDTALADDIEQGRIGKAPRTPAELTEPTTEPVEKKSFSKRKKVVASVLAANALIGAGAFYAAKTLFTDKIEDTLNSNPGVSGPLVPGNTAGAETTSAPEVEVQTLNPEHGFVLYDKDPAMMDNFLTNFIMDTATERYITGVSDIEDLQNVVDIDSNTAKNLDATIDNMVENLERVEKAATEQGLDISAGLTAGMTIEPVEAVSDGTTHSSTSTHEYLAFTATGEYIGHLNSNLETVKVTFEKRELEGADGTPVETGLLTSREIVQQ